MGDRETILRGLAFMLLSPDSYRAGELDSFLNRAMHEINGLSETEIYALECKFTRALRTAKDIFGKYAFRKQYDFQAARSPINKAIFEIWIVGLSALSDSEATAAVHRKTPIRERFAELLIRDGRFDASVSIGTGDAKKVRYRFSKVASLLREVLDAG